MAEEDPQTFEVKVKGAATLEGVEQAIRDKMRTDPTDFFTTRKQSFSFARRKGTSTSHTRGSMKVCLVTAPTATEFHELDEIHSPSVR